MNLETETLVASLLVAASIVLAIVQPLLVWSRSTRRDLLRERWLSSRRGVIVAGASAKLVGYAIAALAVGLMTVRFPFLWGAVALCISGIVSTVIFVVRYHRAVPEFEAELLRAPGSSPVVHRDAVRDDGSEA